MKKEAKTSPTVEKCSRKPLISWERVEKTSIIQIAYECEEENLYGSGHSFFSKELWKTIFNTINIDRFAEVIMGS